jgi:hypothetical protein
LQPSLCIELRPKRNNDRHKSAMTPELWQRLKPLFHAALKKDPQDRAGFLEEVFGYDLELRTHLEQLIEAEEQGTRTITVPLVDLNNRPALRSSVGFAQ